MLKRLKPLYLNAKFYYPNIFHSQVISSKNYCSQCSVCTPQTVVLIVVIINFI